MPVAPQKMIVVLNPASGRGTGTNNRAAIQACLEEEAKQLPTPFQWELWQTTASGEGTQLAERAVKEGADLVVAAGGDGTLAEVLNGTIGTSSQLGLIPCGTGNDCARTLGIALEVRSAVQNLLQGDARPIDVGRTQGHYFLNVAGCGFDAIVAEKVNSGVRFLHGTAAYLAAIMLSMGHMHPYPIRLTLDDRTEDLRAILCSVANTKSYGGGMLIAPDAEIDDGLFDVCILGDTGKIEFLRAFPTVFTGKHIHHPKVRMERARYVKIESETPLPILVDGEVIGTTPVEFQIFPQAVKMRLPHPQ